MQEFKSPVSRLARLFKKGRENWKEKAILKQKQIRALEIKVRDLTDSREKWKKRAMAAEAKLKELKLEEDIEKKQKSKDNQPT